MAYKFQVGEARLSGSLVREGAVIFKDNLGAGIMLELENDGDVNIYQHNGSDKGLKLGDTLVTSTAAHLNLVSGSAAATVVASKAVIYGGSGQILGASLYVNDNGYLGNASVNDLVQLQADGDIIVKDGAYDFDIASHDGSNGLLLGGALVEASAPEINVLNDAVGGTVVNDRAVIYNGAGKVAATSMSASAGISGSSLLLDGQYGITRDGGLAVSKFNTNWTNADRTIANLGTVSAATSITSTALIVSGNTDLGNATSNTITATGRFDSALVPSSDSTRDLGTSALRWSTIYVDSIVGADITADTEKYGAAPLGYTLSSSVDFALLSTAAQTYTLPAASAGKKIDVKLSGSIHTCTISAASGDSIEGGASVILESTGSAISLVAMDATHWFIV